MLFYKKPVNNDYSGCCKGFNWSKSILNFVHCNYKNESVCAKVRIFVKLIRSPLLIKNKKMPKIAKVSVFQ